MLRRFLVILIRRSLFILLLVCLGCVAQSAPPDLARNIEHQVRSFYTIPSEVKVTVGAITPSSDMPGYDTVSVTINGGDQSDTFNVVPGAPFQLTFESFNNSNAGRPSANSFTYGK